MTTTEPVRPARTRITTHVAALDELIGSHPSALESIYRKSDSCDPADLGEAPRGVVLALSGLSPVHLLSRPLLRFASTRLVPWSGVVFDHGGCAGANRSMGRQVARFRVSAEPSLLDARPCLALAYENSSLAWLRDELRSVAPGIALGATYVRGSLVGWFGLERSRG
jgi:hypothetical protein